jgi:acyl-CoA thioesterase-1
MTLRGTAGRLEYRLRFLTYLVLALMAWSSQAHAQTIHIVAFGTSFTAGKGVSRSEAFPARLESLLRSAGEDVEIANEGRNGDTTENLLVRLDSAVPGNTDIVILEYALGNDRKRNISEDRTISNVEEIVSRLAARNIETLLVIRARNEEALQVHTKWFADTVSKYRISSIAVEQPESSLQSDMQHPTAEAHGQIAASMVPYVTALIARVKAKRK